MERWETNFGEKGVQDDIGSVEDSSDDLEKSKIMMMRSIVELQEPTSKDVDCLTLRRFLRARDQDVDKASKLFLKYLRWRATFVPNGYIDISEIPNNLAQNKVFVQGVDKEGRPIGVILGQRHRQTSLDEFKRFAVYCLDKMCASIPKGQETFVCITDLEGWGYANCDVRAYSGALTLLQDCYPERLGKLFIVHVPYIFMAAWKLVSPFIDNKTKKKIVFVEDKLLKETLLEYIEENELPEIYGGKKKLVPIQDLQS
uniref:CRAL-TRIO domain-containing protein n=1 Tax=Kalanchoe fedtschenkoi TaxID=63787 RepID=A0A7N0UH72_KALFE